MEGEKPIEVNIHSILDEKSSIEFRTHRNPERGTEIEYVTIPLEIIDSPDFYREVEVLLDRFYDSQGEEKPVDEDDYKRTIGHYVSDIKNFVASGEKEDWFNLGPRKKDSNKRNDEQKQYMFSMKREATKLVILQQPVVHAPFAARRQTETPFEGLLSILNEGFISSNTDGNTKRKTHKDHRFSGGYIIKMKGEAGDIRRGDSYSVELFPEEGQRAGSDYATRKASADRISSVNIHLDDSASPEEKEEKMAFYKKEIFEKYKVPVRFFVLMGDEKDEKNLVRILPKS